MPSEPPLPDMPSLLISALPASVQSRIPHIPSLRRTMSVQGLFSRSDAALSTSASLTALPTEPQPSSAPSPASSATVSSTSSPLPSLPPSRPSTSHARSGSANDYGLVLADGAITTFPSPSSSQINWKYAQHGFRSLQNAAREAGDPDRLPALERQMYVDSVAYLLRGLPGDLGGGELSQLRHAAPDCLVPETAPPAPQVPVAAAAPAPVHVQVYQNNYPVVAADERMSSNPGLYTVTAAQQSPRQRTLPHRATHWLITALYGLVLALLPVAVRAAHWALEMQRKHHVSEAVLRWAAAVAALVYRRALELYVAVCTMGDGSLKRALDDGTAYLASGVAAGFHEAVLDVARGQL